MDLYVILRRNGWSSAAELEEAAARSSQVGNEDMPYEVRWIRSSVLEKGRGSVGTVFGYAAPGPGALKRHAECAQLPADEIMRIADTVIARRDPEPANA